MSEFQTKLGVLQHRKAILKSSVATVRLPKQYKPKRVTTMDQAEITEVVADAEVVSSKKVESTGIEFKKKDLIDAIAETTDHKRSDVKEITEALLRVLGERIATGDTLNLQPFGKLTLLNEKTTPNARILKAKIRQSISSADKEAVESDAVD